MPSPNIVKDYIKDGIYHIYNRGVEKRNIFMDEQDYKIFLYYLKSYLLPLEKQRKEEQAKMPLGIRHIRVFDLPKQIKLLAYCLMPNHFHFLMKQSSERAIVEFMKRLSNAYVKYFNKKYKRQGGLFQGNYKASFVSEEIYFTYLSSYIHRNPLGLFLSISGEEKIRKMRKYPYSSYLDYLGERNTRWVNTKEVLSLFKDKNKEFISEFNSYQKFVEELEVEDLLERNMVFDDEI